MRVVVYFSAFALMTVGCRKDGGERIFEMLFPNIVFEIPAGLNPNFQQVFELQVVPTSIDAYLSDFQTDTTLIRAILPLSARLTSLDGNAFGYGFMEAVSVRICDPVKPNCFDGDEVFYIDDLRGRAGQEIRLIPGLRNARRDLIRRNFRLEVVFVFNSTTPYSVRSRLQMNFEAVK